MIKHIHVNDVKNKEFRTRTARKTTYHVMSNVKRTQIMPVPLL